MAAPIVKRFLVSLEDNKYVGLTVAILVMGAASVMAFLPPDPPPPTKYRAIGVLRYSTPPPIATETGRNLIEQGRNAITEQLLLNDKVVFEGASVANMLDKKPEKFLERINIEFPEQKEGEEAPPQIIRVEYVDQKEEIASQTLDTMLKEMVEQSRLFNTAQLRSQIEALEERAAEAKQELQVAERQFYEYMSQQGSSMIAAQDGSLFASISAAQQQQRELEQQLEGVQSQINSLSNQLNLTPDQAATAAALSADPIIAQLRAQILDAETQKEMLAKDLRPEHPQMKALLQQIESYEQLLIERANEVIGEDDVFEAVPREIRKDSSLDPTRQELANRLLSLEAQKESIARQLQVVRSNEQEMRRDYEQFPTKQLEMTRLQQQLQIKKQFFEGIQARLVDAQSAEAETSGNLSIAQEPVIKEEKPEISAPPNPIIILAGGVVGGVVAGAVVILGLSFLDPRLHTPQELRALLSDRDLLVLAELPWLESVADDELPILTGKNLPYLDVYERCRSTLRRSAPKNSKVVLVTSVSRQEGKSTTAYNLAIASAHAGKRTLLIEGDMRSPSHAKTVQLGVDPDAQSEPLAYYSSHNECVRLVPNVENLYLAPSAGPQRKAAAIVESSEMRRLVEDARQRFDMVIMDTPSLTRANDALLLYPLTDGFIIVTRPGVSKGKEAGAMLDQMVEAEMPILGAVINGVDMPAPEPYQGEESAALPTSGHKSLASASPTLNGNTPSSGEQLPPPVGGRKR
ncbi:MAG: AAA family ATPase [Kamptonema sp. SIO4C4]|nr:AAA family ATPase [Kamptonema sp. SIO4C4]